MSEFVMYWNAYGDEEEARKAPKNTWSSSSISKGIVIAAIKGIVSIIDQYPYESISLKKLDDEVFLYDRRLNYHGIRVTILATSSLSAEIPTMLTREIVEKSRESLCVCILPTTEHSIWPYDSENRQAGAANLIPLYPSDIDALAQGKIDFLGLIEYKLVRRLMSDKSDPETQFNPRLYEEFTQTSKDYLPTVAFEQLEKVLEESDGDLS
jgi:hypothetical protein